MYSSALKFVLLFVAITYPGCNQISSLNDLEWITKDTETLETVPDDLVESDEETSTGSDDQGKNIPDDSDGSKIDTDITIGNACSEDGALRCAAAGSVAREECSDGQWVETAPCAEGMVCNLGDTENPGECISAAKICQGSSGENVCKDTILYQCGKNATILEHEECNSERLCQLGVSSGKCVKCIPGTYICNGAELKECNQKGDAYSSKETCTTKALCNATVGACTEKICLPDTWECTRDDILRRCNKDQTRLEDVKQCDDGMCNIKEKKCDICLPSKVRCEDKAVITCSSDGQKETDKACPSPRTSVD